ncbi:redox-sensing transcriptional repressor [Lachnospiraceae bacterium PF1-21]|uniref:Redox-sensing transcriptional repressor Rex n=1 Tax=Ohessyouella blattaphilus TaxID=2949333 RepID=A0ABT1EEQ0_9FIRM|nr:redox-sensing transcriptional repressor Rex [Ohessyouella blattaphilus]MCP1109179.1 redox-sensing transcriptional repressor Rex [Ohessyouella blattaphilus]MCR8562573.1 redox-sensing transcriptional repressor Rex [Ohessyouella blattaphilus]MDL2250557.1 redox-sensing transcriptional repressor Rex [Lachnospiraceae bacterium OttesenSCG-928-J05]
MREREISQAVITRLPRYYRYLGELLEDDIERISSNELSKRMQVTASQIRQDLNNFGGFGQQGYGYNVKYLYTEIGKILGLDVNHNYIIIGAGNLGQALANYTTFERRGFILRGIFDNNPVMEDVTIRGIPVRMMDELKDFIAKNNVEIAVLTIPKEHATDVASHLVEAGIKAIWNFAHTDLAVPESVMVENVHLSESLMKLSYRLKQNGEHAYQKDN